ncbi:MAG TPA: hypothetical protein ENN17_05930 [bacterium]|nr:hypothetical protein [bacterium]
MKIWKIWTIGFLCSVFFGSATGQFPNTYPRTGAFHWGGGASAAWFAQYDFIMSTFTSSSFARSIKEINPNAVIVATRDINGGRQAVETFYDEWIVRNSQGGHVKIYGGGSTLADLTKFCPKVGGKQYSDAVIEYMSQLVDLKVFDGIATDGLWGAPWGDAQRDIDLDRNGINDYDEHGRDWVIARWTEGAGKIVQGLDAALPPQKIFVVNGTTLPPYRSSFNGYVFEYGGGFTGAKWYSGFSTYSSLMETLQEPQAIYIDGCPGWRNVSETVNVRNDFQLMRFALCTALMGNGFFGHQIRYKDHYLMSYYDEFEVDLGMPTSKAHQTMKVGTDAVFVRFFEKGVVVLNVRGEPVTFTDAGLKQFAEYDGPYYSFKGGQDPDWNTGEIFSSRVLDGNPLSGGPRYFGDAMVLVNSEQTVITDIIIDNSEYDTSPGSDPAVIVGAWTKDCGGGGWGSGCFRWLGQYLSEYAWSGDGSSYAIYRPTISVSGVYELFEWHGAPGVTASVATDVPFLLTVEGNKVLSRTIDQSKHLSQWNSLGQYYFSKNADVRMTINNEANGLVIADAFKLKYVGTAIDTIPPLSPTGLKLDEATERTILLSWQSPPAASDGDTVMFYEIFRNNKIAGICYKPSFKDENLTESTQYAYKIIGYDNFGNASETPLTGNFSTIADLNGPEITKVMATGMYSIEISFDEPVDRSTAETHTNYQIDQGVMVSLARLHETSKRVVLTTTSHTPGEIYRLTVQNVKDLSIAGNIIEPNTQKTYEAVSEAIVVTAAADNEYELFINGEFIGSGDNWSTGTRYEVLSIPGKNVVAIKGIDKGGVAGLVAEIEFMGRKYVSNETWRVSTVEQFGWQDVVFDDLSWPKATSWGLHGTAAPWASYRNVTNISTDDDVHWIWSSDWDNDNLVFFRFSLHTDAELSRLSPPQGVQVRLEQ